MSTLHALRRLQKETKAKVYLVGGFVRDYMRGRENNDLDIVVRFLEEDSIMNFLKNHGKCKIVELSKANDAFTTRILLFRAKDDRHTAQISLPRRGRDQIAWPNNTLRQDAKYRDFRINSLYLPIDFKSKRDVIDPSGTDSSLHDLKAKLITSEDANVFKMSPIRLLRLISLAARTEFRIHTMLLEYAKKDAPLILQAPAEAVQIEFNKIILSNRPSKYIRLMNKIGLLGHILPELARCSGVKQDVRYHKYDVFEHCIRTCDHIEADLTLRLAGLFHDIGKPDVKTVVGDRVRFHKHEIYSVKLTRSILGRLKYDNTTKDKVLKLIRMHMYHYTREYTDAGVRRFIRQVDLTDEDLKNLSEIPLFKLRKAERLGNGFKTDPVTQRQLDFENRIIELMKKGTGLKKEDLDINGLVIMQAFNVQGTVVGEILEHLLKQVRKDKSLNNRVSLIELALSFLKNKEGKSR